MGTNTGHHTLLEGLGEAELLARVQEEAQTEAFAQESKDGESKTSNYSFDSLKVQELCKKSLDFLGALAAPTVFKYLFPPVFLSVWIWLLDNVNKIREFPKLALGLPRGFAKTTVIKLFVLYCILFTNKKFILVISSTAKLAENIIFDIQAFLDEPNIKRVFGDWRIGMVQDTLAMKKFGYRGRNIVLAGIGAGTSLRGLNLNNSRPDVMIFEDIQTREDADSEVLSKALETWMIGTAMKAKSPEGCMFLFVANMYPTKYSLLRKLKANPTWTKFIAGGILADGTSLWEELHPIATLLVEFENDLAMGHPEIFYSEVLNDENAAANNLVDFSKLPEYEWPDDSLPEGNFVLIDPAGWKKKSDEVAIGYFIILGGKPVLRHVTSARLSPADCIRVALKYCLENNCRFVCIEGVAYQVTLGYWFQFICTQMGITGIEVGDVHPGGVNKNSAILGMFKSYQAGEILAHPSVRGEFHAQVTSFNPLKKDNTDDILDLMRYAPKVLELHAQFIVSMGEVGIQEWGATHVLEDNCDFLSSTLDY